MSMATRKKAISLIYNYLNIKYLIMLPVELHFNINNYNVHLLLHKYIETSRKYWFH